MSIDWTRGLESQRFRYMLVDPDTWTDTDELEDVKSASITWESSADTLISATIESDGVMPTGERIVRVYHEASQGTERSRDCVCTVIAQTPTHSVDGFVGNYKMDCYGTLLELKDDQPPIGFSVASGTDPLQAAATLARAHSHSPVIMPDESRPMDDVWVAEDSDTWLSTVKALAALGDAQVMVDAFGRIRFEPVKRVSAVAPTRTFDDSNSSIILPKATVSTDMYGIPNVVEVVFSEDTKSVSAEVTDTDETRYTSLPIRGRRVLKRIVNPDELQAGTTRAGCASVASARLSDLAHTEQTVSFSHALLFPMPELGECVRLDYGKFDIDVSAQVSKQRLTCETGATVATTASWRS